MCSATNATSPTWCLLVQDEPGLLFTSRQMNRSAKAGPTKNMSLPGVLNVDEHHDEDVPHTQDIESSLLGKLRLWWRAKLEHRPGPYGFRTRSLPAFSTTLRRRPCFVPKIAVQHTTHLAHSSDTSLLVYDEDIPAHKRRKSPSSGLPRRLDTYVNISLIPFVPYLDKIDKRLRNYQYSYTKPDDNWIDIDRLETWIRTCDTQHPDHCRSSPTINSSCSKIMPVWLIDVREACLVAAKDGDKYVCLSYVWGQSHSDNLSMTMANLDTLRAPQSLTKDPMLLPLTVSHALSLTRLLGETYLWVDRLCIPQTGDENTKSHQLNSMADIYGNAYFTIVAAQGDAAAGLRGIYGVTPPRVLVEPLKYQDHYEAFTKQATRLMRTEWYTRGWTYQEHVCSRRKIIFHNDTVNWECHCSAWYENQELSGLDVQEASFPCEKMPPSNNTGFETTTWPNFYRYARLVALYNQRSLTYPQDILVAFAGLLSVLGPTFDGGFICGLPQMFFDSALLWQPYRALQRREVKMDEGTTPTWPSIPSWSWIGWKGNLHSESWRSSYDYMKKNPDEVLKIDQDGHTHWAPATWHTIHTVDWRYSADVESQQSPVIVSSQKYRADAINEQMDLPTGWSRIKSKYTRDYYRHDSISEQEFWYPIPLQESFTTPQHLEHLQLRPLLLHARTRHCRLTLGDTYVNPEASQCLSCDLLNADGKWTGALRLNISDQSKFGEKIECRLIELSSGYVYNQDIEAVSFDEWYRPDCPRNNGKYEFYNVLWVEDRGKVSYRKALGRVMKSVWEKYSIEADVILG